MSTEETLLQCAECGAGQPDGADCQACFHALLAFENERPAVFGAVHHLTVTTYYLQHPRGYTLRALRMWRDVLATSLDGVASPHDLLRRVSREFAGATRVRDPAAVLPAAWPRAWPITVQGVFRPGDAVGADEYMKRARVWAAETRRALDRADALPAADRDEPNPARR